MKAKILSYLCHYIYGLFAQCFNGGITSLVAITALDTTGRLPEGVTFTLCWHIYGTAIGVHALLYLHEHQVPSQLPTDIERRAGSSLASNLS